MAGPARPWTVSAHGPLRALSPRLHVVSGPIPGISMPLARTMAVVRRADGTLLVHSAIACDDATMGAVEALGEPHTLVVPNAWHKLDAPAWKARYPKVRVVCPRAATKTVAAHVAVDGALEDL